MLVEPCQCHLFIDIILPKTTLTLWCNIVWRSTSIFPKDFLARTHVTRTRSTGVFIFLLSQVSQRQEIISLYPAQNDTLFSTKRHVVFHQTIRRFSSNITSFSLLFEPISRISLNECYKDVANHCSIVFYNNLCDTCDSKNIKTPGMRARMRTRECTFKICLLSYFCPLFLHHFSISLSVKTQSFSLLFSYKLLSLRSTPKPSRNDNRTTITKLEKFCRCKSFYRPTHHCHWHQCEW